MIGICPDCKKYKKLTKHSKIGGHQKPFIWICRDCHDKRDGIEPNETKRQMSKCKKYQPGTKRMHKKK